MIISDKQRISQVLVNLLNNAIKFTFEGFIKIKIEKFHYNQQTIVIEDIENQKSYERDGLKTRPLVLKIGVTDTGIGMRETDLKKLFKIFGGSNSTKRSDDDPNP